MNLLNEHYYAFIESVCNQFGCKDAIRPLQEGFSALCEGLLEDEDPFGSEPEDPFDNGPENPFDRKCISCGRRIPYGYLHSQGLCPECEKETQSYMYTDDGPEEPQ